MSSRHAIVVGSGLAGLSAASQLISRNVHVRLIERSAKPGGNSIKASSGINGSPTTYQPVMEPPDAFYKDTVRSAGHAISSMTSHRETLIATLTKNSANAVDWLVQEKGVDLSQVAQLGGHSFARTHRSPAGPPPGFAIVSALLKDLKQSSLFDLRTSCNVTRILQSGRRITGVEYVCEDGTIEVIHGPVIFASGGFGGDAEGLLAKYRPDLAGYPSTNDPRPGSQPLLTAIGAQLIDMDQVQLHPTGFIDPMQPSSPLKVLAAEVLRGEGGILLLDGERFVHELETRENVVDAITSTVPTSTFPKQWKVQVVLDEGTYSATKSHVDFYLLKDLMEKTTLSELGLKARESIIRYSQGVATKSDAFQRTAFANWKLLDATHDSVLYLGTVTPVTHFTMGGVLIDEKSQVLGEDNEPIQGLWSAGEVSGGVHGGNRLGGSSLLECVVFGRIAGDQCAEYIHSRI
jgi:FAD-dependent fumarate reductase